jgi:hypothetical protein
MAIPPLILRIYADSRGVRAGVASAQRSVGGMKNFMQRNAGLIGVALAGAFVTVGVKAVKAFNESEAAIAQTNAVLKSTKGIAGVTSGEVTKLATSLQKLTTFSDEEVRSAENLLLTFTNISDDIFPDTTKAVLNMSQALGQDLKSSSIQLGKALNDPILGLTSLSRVGVKFTQDTRDQIKALVEQGNTLQAQKIILRELATEFGGSATKAAKTFGGQMKQVANQMDDLLEEVGRLVVVLGKHLIPALEFGIRALRKMVANLEIMISAVVKAAVWFNVHFVQPTIQAWQMLVDIIGKGVGLIKRGLIAAWQAVRGPVLAVIHAITWAVNGLVAVVQAAVDALQFLAKLGSQATYSRPAGTGVGKFAMGAKAAGGPVEAWRPYKVGEAGSEWFVPKVPGTILPHGESPAGGLTVNVYGDVNDAERFTRKVVTAIERAAARL